jgi:hypothetical protein
MLSRIAAKNFKAFGSSPGLNLPLSALNLLLGENNSGKTSALDVVALLVQTARRPQINGIVWSGDLVDLGLTGDFARHSGSAAPIEISLEIEPPEDMRGKPSPFGGEIETIGTKITFHPASQRYMYEFLTDGHVLVRNLVKETPTRGQQAQLEIGDYSAQSLQMDFIPASQTQTSIFNPGLYAAANLPPNTPKQKAALARLEIAQIGIQAIQRFLMARIFMLGPNRGDLAANLDENFELPNVGRNGRHTLQVLSAIFARAEHRRAAEQIREWSNIFGLFEVSSGWAGGKELHSGYADPLARLALPLRSAGFGSQQMLPIIVQLFASPPGSLVVIEEPEISLHPAAQVQLVRMFYSAVAGGRQVIITTHSQYLVMALQQQSEPSFPSAEISAYHFSRTDDGSSVVKLEIDSSGILRGWIPSFSTVEKDLLNTWMAKVHDKLSDE